MKTSLYLLAFALLLLPIAVWAERTHPGFWQQRLFARSFGYEPGRQDLVHSNGYVIPSYIEQDLTLTPQDNPVLLIDTVTVSPEAKLTIDAGTTIYTHEFSNILVKGDLDIKGTKENLVNIYSNHKHPSRFAWAGITFEQNSTGNINYAAIRHGSPAIACLENSQVTINNTRLHMGDTGLFTSSPTCTLSNSVIHGVRDGIVTLLPNYEFTNSTVQGSRRDLLVGKPLELR